MSIGTKSNSVCCSVCGLEIKGPFKGRIPDYCSKDCREFRKYLNAVSRCLMSIKPTHSHRQRIRSELFTLSNQITPAIPRAAGNEAMRGAGGAGDGPGHVPCST